MFAIYLIHRLENIQSYKIVSLVICALKSTITLFYFFYPAQTFKFNTSLSAKVNKRSCFMVFYRAFFSELKFFSYFRLRIFSVAGVLYVRSETQTGVGGDPFPHPHVQKCFYSSDTTVIC